MKVDKNNAVGPLVLRIRNNAVHLADSGWWGLPAGSNQFVLCFHEDCFHLLAPPEHQNFALRLAKNIDCVGISRTFLRGTKEEGLEVYLTDNSDNLYMIGLVESQFDGLPVDKNHSVGVFGFRLYVFQDEPKCIYAGVTEFIHAPVPSLIEAFLRCVTIGNARNATK